MQLWAATIIKAAMIAAIVRGIAGCASSPPAHFYTLSADTESARPSNPLTMPITSAASNLSNPLSNPAPFYIEVAPVNIPAQIARTQLVLTTHAGEVELKEQQRWSAPLHDEIRDALSAALVNRLSTTDVYRMPYTLDRPVYRITVNIQRFTSTLGKLGDAHHGLGHASISATWSIRLTTPYLQSENAVVLTCHSLASESVDANYRALVVGHQRALAHIADDIALAIRQTRCSGTN